MIEINLIVVVVAQKFLFPARDLYAKKCLKKIVNRENVNYDLGVGLKFKF